MQLPFFYEENLPAGDNNFDLSEATSKHVAQVLRMRAGDSLIVTNGKGLALKVSVVSPHKKKTEVSVLERNHFPAPGNSNGIAISLLKNENRFEWFLEKATEMGIQNIYPIITARTEKRSFRKDRMVNILISAMLQSRQYYLPFLADPVRLDEIFTLTGYNQKLIAHCVDDDKKAELRDTLEKGTPAIVLIGPEGDFTEEEIRQCLEKGYTPVSLGKTRLRTETAGINAAVYLSN